MKKAAPTSTGPNPERVISLQSLFCCFKLWLLAKDKQREQLPLSGSSGFTWGNFSRAAHYHNQEALLFSLIQNGVMSPEGIPDDIMKKWETASYTNLFFNTQLLSRGTQLLAECERKGIPIIFMKGLSSIASVYKDMRLRPMTDLDILCTGSNIKALSETAASLGYQNCSFANFYHLLFFHLKDEFPLEIHFQMYDTLSREKIFSTLAWKRKMFVDFENVRIPVFSLEDQVVLDVAHILYHDHLVTLKHYFDFYGKLFSFSRKINWEYLWHMLALTGLKTEFICLSHVLSDSLGIPLELPVRSDVPDHTYLSKKKTILKKLLSIGFVKTPVVGNRLKNQPGVLRKMNYVSKRLFPSVAVMKATYKPRTSLETILFYPHHIRSQLLFFWKRKKDFRTA